MVGKAKAVSARARALQPADFSGSRRVAARPSDVDMSVHRAVSELHSPHGLESDDSGDPVTS